MEPTNDLLLACMVGIVIGCFLNPTTALAIIIGYIFVKNEKLPGNMYPREIMFNIAFNTWLITSKFIRRPVETEKIQSASDTQHEKLQPSQPQLLLQPQSQFPIQNISQLPQISQEQSQQQYYHLQLLQQLQTQQVYNQYQHQQEQLQQQSNVNSTIPSPISLVSRN